MELYDSRFKYTPVHTTWGRITPIEVEQNQWFLVRNRIELDDLGGYLLMKIRMYLLLYVHVFVQRLVGT